MLMQQYQGTTRQYWLEEDAGFVERVLIAMDEEAKEQNLRNRRAWRK